jgi:hypothetical protein
MPGERGNMQGVGFLRMDREIAKLVEWARAIAGPRPSKNRTCELAPHPAQAWSKHLSQGAGTRLSLAENLPLAIRNGR